MTQMPDPLDARRRRLVWRASHRGMKEIDLIVGTYARREAKAMDEPALADFEALLDYADADLYDWLVRCLSPPPNADRALIEALKKIRFETQSYGQF